MLLWTTEHRMFTYNSYVKNNESTTAVRCKFRRHFNTHQRCLLPPITQSYIGLIHITHKVHYWTRDRWRPYEQERVWQTRLRSPDRSARRYSIELSIVNRSVRCILHGDLHFHPNKFVVVHFFIFLSRGINIVNWITMTRKSAEHLRTIYGNTGQLFRHYWVSSAVYTVISTTLYIYI